MSNKRKGVQSPTGEDPKTNKGGQNDVPRKKNKQVISGDSNANLVEPPTAKPASGRSRAGQSRSNRSVDRDKSNARRNGRNGTSAASAGKDVPKRGAEVSTKRNRNNEQSGQNQAFRSERNVYSGSLELVFRTTWIKLVEDISPDSVHAFKRAMDSMDTASFIQKAGRITTNILRETQPIIEDQELYYVITLLPIKDALQCLRFGKRYCPSSKLSSKDQNVAVSDFLVRNKRNRLIDQDGSYIPHWLVRELQRISKSIFSCAHLQFKPNRTLEGDLRALPHGTTADGFRLPFEKWVSTHAAYHYYGSYIEAGISHHELDDDLWLEPCVLKLVPKDSKGPRLIMEECLEHTLRQTPIADYLLRVANKPSLSPYSPYGHITLDDQRQNGYLAYLGSIDKSLCTIDLHNASDCITQTLVNACFPTEVAEAIMCNCPHRVQLPDGRIVKLYMPMTMGSRVTPIGQSLINWMIYCAAYDYGCAHNMVSKYALQQCSVYNDDGIVPNDMYDISVEFQTLCGLIVNDDKSFTGDSPFRESCGVDAWDGQIVTSLYWPRKELEVTADYLPEWIALQNRLFSAGMRGSAAYLSTVIRQIEPKVPSVLPDSREMGIYAHERHAKVTPYQLHCWNVYVLVHKVDKGMYIYGQFEENYAILSFHAYVDPKPGHSHCVTTWEELQHIIKDYKYVSLDIKSCNWYDTKQLQNLHGRILNRFRPMDIPGVFHYQTSQLAVVYDNRLSDRCFDKNIVNQAMLEYLWDDYAYNHSLLHGPEYFDDLCKYLHITQPRKLRKSQIESSFKVRSTVSTVMDPGLVNSAETHYNKKLEELGKLSKHDE